MKYSTVSLILSVIATALTASADLTVFAAVSMSDAMKDLAAAYSKRGGGTVLFNFASSGALARQIDAGAPADLFVCANVKWMDWLQDRRLIDPRSRFDLTGNRLVMIAPEGSDLTFTGATSGRLAVGDFNSVPAGIYAREALVHMGWMDALLSRLVTGSSVRSVLMYVERGEVDAGIVYASDAKASSRVQMVGIFPADSHSPIIYPVAACSANPATADFLMFLKTEEAKTILRQHGFTEPQNA